MAEEERRFERDYVDPRDPGECQPGRLPRSVESAELAAIAKRRGWLKEHGGAARDAAGLTGLSLSGGGIRSASFGLGCLQALQAVYKDGRGGEKEKIISGIEKIDYLSTVSGGGYIGACLTAAMQDIGQNCKSAGKFPFVETDDYSDTDAVRHIRDFSNYLIPHGPMDVFTAFGIIAAASLPIGSSFCLSSLLRFASLYCSIRRSIRLRAKLAHKAPHRIASLARVLAWLLAHGDSRRAEPRLSCRMGRLNVFGIWVEARADGRL